MKITKTQIIEMLKTTILVLILGLGIGYAVADWTAPGVNPPTCPATNPACLPPINVGSGAQNKTGELGLGILKMIGYDITRPLTWIEFGRMTSTNQYQRQYRIRSNATSLDILSTNPPGSTNNTLLMRMYPNGNTLLGSETNVIYPDTKLDVRGKVSSAGLAVLGDSYLGGRVQIVNGSQGAGKVLTSDASGIATWQPAGGGGIANTIFSFATSPLYIKNPDEHYLCSNDRVVGYYATNGIWKYEDDGSVATDADCGHPLDASSYDYYLGSGSTILYAICPAGSKAISGGFYFHVKKDNSTSLASQPGVFYSNNSTYLPPDFLSGGWFSFANNRYWSCYAESWNDNGACYAVCAK